MQSITDVDRREFGLDHTSFPRNSTAQVGTFVSPEIEGAAARKIEPRVMPVAS